MIALGSSGATTGVEGANPIELPNTQKGRLTSNAFSKMQAEMAPEKLAAARRALSPGAEGAPEEKPGRGLLFLQRGPDQSLLTESGRTFHRSECRPPRHHGALSHCADARVTPATRSVRTCPDNSGTPTAARQPRQSRHLPPPPAAKQRCSRLWPVSCIPSDFWALLLAAVSSPSARKTRFLWLLSYVT